MNVTREGGELVITGEQDVCVWIRLAPTSPDSALGPVEYHHHRATYRVGISTKGLAAMVATAFRNKSRRATDGPVTVKILSSEPLAVERERGTP